WALLSTEPKIAVRTVFPRPAGRGGSREAVHLSGRTALGRYLRRGQFGGSSLSVDDAPAVIASLLRVLARYGVLDMVEEVGDGVPGYRLKASALIWRVGGGTAGAPDPLRRIVDPEVGLRVNEFFRDLYRQTAAELGGLSAREHTAQVRAEDRLDRERA